MGGATTAGNEWGPTRLSNRNAAQPANCTDSFHLEANSTCDVTSACGRYLLMWQSLTRKARGTYNRREVCLKTEQTSTTAGRVRIAMSWRLTQMKIKKKPETERRRLSRPPSPRRCLRTSGEMRRGRRPAEHAASGEAETRLERVFRGDFGPRAPERAAHQCRSDCA